MKIKFLNAKYIAFGALIALFSGLSSQPILVAKDLNIFIDNGWKTDHLKSENLVSPGVLSPFVKVVSYEPKAVVVVNDSPEGACTTSDFARPADMLVQPQDVFNLHSGSSCSSAVLPLTFPRFDLNPISVSRPRVEYIVKVNNSANFSSAGLSVPGQSRPELVLPLKVASDFASNIAYVVLNIFLLIIVALVMVNVRKYSLAELCILRC